MRYCTNIDIQTSCCDIFLKRNKASSRTLGYLSTFSTRHLQKKTMCNHFWIFIGDKNIVWNVYQSQHICSLNQNFNSLLLKVFLSSHVVFKFICTTDLPIMLRCIVSKIFPVSHSLALLVIMYIMQKRFGPSPDSFGTSYVNHLKVCPCSGAICWLCSKIGQADRVRLYYFCVMSMGRRLI